MSRPWLRPTLIGVGIVAIALGAGYFFLEPTEETVNRGFQGEAKVNRYLAFQEILTAVGIPSRSVAGVPRLPSTDHALVVAARRRNSGLAGAERLLEWVRSGGHLVVIPVGVWADDPILDELGIVLFDESGADDDDHESRSGFQSDRPDWPLLYQTGDWPVFRSDGAEDAAWLLSIEVGQGVVTALSDGDFLRNDAIVEKDHALIGWTAVTLGGQAPAGAWIVVRDPPPSLLSLIGEEHEPVVISALVLTGILLIMLARRRGPMLEPVPRERRHFAEHLQAVGSYLWSVGAEDRLLDASRQALRGHLARGNPRGAEASLEELMPKAAVGDDAVLWQDAMTTNECRDPKRFLRIMRYLETLRRSS